MSRSGYSDDVMDWDWIRWRGAVSSALRGKRGQAFLREALTALDALPEPKLIGDVLVSPEGCCLMGAVAIHRQLDVSGIDPHDRERVAGVFGIAEAMAAEISSVNDDGFYYGPDSPEKRFIRVRLWVESQIAGNR